MFSRSKKSLAVVLAGVMPLSACTTTHFYGEYRPIASAHPDDVGGVGAMGRHTKETMNDLLGKSKQEPIIAEGNSWLFVWGALNTGSVEVDNLLSSSFKDRPITNISVEDRISILGVICVVLTVGIFSHHDIIVRGAVGPETPQTPPAKAEPAPSSTTTPQNP